MRATASSVGYQAMGSRRRAGSSNAVGTGTDAGEGTRAMLMSWDIIGGPVAPRIP